MKKIYLFLLSVVIVIGLKAQTSIDTAVDFSVKDINGHTHKLFQILDSNNYVVLDFVTTTCGPCVTYAPDFQQAYVHYGSNTCGVYFLAIVWGANNAAVWEFDSIYGLTHPSVSSLQGNGQSVLNAYGVMSYPTPILIAPNREIVNNHIYPPSFHILDSTITAATSVTSVAPEPVAVEKPGIFPNPAKDEITISYKLSKSSDIRFDISSILGEKLISVAPEAFGKGQVQKRLNVSSLPSGIYFVKISTRGETLTTMKFVKR